MQPTGSQILIAQLPPVLTGKLSHILPFVLLTARCDWWEEEPLAQAAVLQIAVPRSGSRSVPHRGDRGPCRAEGSAQLPGTPGSCCPPQSASRGLPPGASPSAGAVPSRATTPHPRSLPRHPFHRAPAPAAGSEPVPHNRDCSAPERRGWCAGDPGRGEGRAQAPLSPWGTVLPSQRRRPRQPGPLTGFPGRETPLAPKHDERLSPPLPCRLALPRAPLPRAARPRRREGRREEGSPRRGPAPPLPCFPGAQQRRGRQQGRAAEAALAAPQSWSPSSCAFPRPWVGPGGRDGGGPAQAGGDRPGGGRGLHGGGAGTGGGRAAGARACAPLRRRRKGRAGRDSAGPLQDSRQERTASEAASDWLVFGFSVELHKALILDFLVCCYLPFTPTFSFIAVIKGKYLASAFFSLLGPFTVQYTQARLVIGFTRKNRFEASCLFSGFFHQVGWQSFIDNIKVGRACCSEAFWPSTQHLLSIKDGSSSPLTDPVLPSYPLQIVCTKTSAQACSKSHLASDLCAGQIKGRMSLWGQRQDWARGQEPRVGNIL